MMSIPLGERIEHNENTIKWNNPSQNKILKREVEKMTCNNYFNDENIASRCGMFVYILSIVTAFGK